MDVKPVESIHSIYQLKPKHSIDHHISPSPLTVFLLLGREGTWGGMGPYLTVGIQEMCRR